MAFPATYNFSYYRGDTFEFNITPKDAAGNEFDLSGYTSRFTIANQRGTGAIQVECFSEIDGNVVKCAITPLDNEDANFPTASQAVYDVEIMKPAGINDDYDFVYTLMTGTITFTNDITGAVEESS
jgi:hypothetical protein